MKEIAAFMLLYWWFPVGLIFVGIQLVVLSWFQAGKRTDVLDELAYQRALEEEREHDEDRWE